MSDIINNEASPALLNDLVQDLTDSQLVAVRTILQGIVRYLLVHVHSVTLSSSI